MSYDSPVTRKPEHAAAVPGIAAADGSAEEEEISLLDLLLAVAERKGVVLRITAYVSLLALVISLILPIRYTATVSLLPPQENSSLGGALASQLGNLGGMAALAGGGLGIKSPNERYVAMLKSRTVEDAMVNRFSLMKEYHKRYLSDARKAFESHSTVDGSGKDGLIHLSVEDRDARRASELANGYVDQFRELSQHLALTEASQRRLFFQQELEQAKNNLAGAEEALEQTEQKTGVIQPDSQAKALIESAAALRAQITAREVQIQGMQTYATGENSSLIQAQQELAGMRAQLAKLGGSEETSGNEFMIPKGLIPKTGMEYVRRLRDVKYYETIFEILARQFEVAKLDEAKEGSVIQVVDPAVVPDKKSFPQRGLIVLGGVMVGLILGIVTALFQAFWNKIHRDPESFSKIDQLRREVFSRSSASEDSPR